MILGWHSFPSTLSVSFNFDVPISCISASASPSSQYSVQSLSRVWLLATPWTATCHASLSITNSQTLLKLLSIELVMPYNHLILCCPLLLLPSIFSSIRVFSNEVSSLHQVAKGLEFRLPPLAPGYQHCLDWQLLSSSFPSIHGQYSLFPCLRMTNWAKNIFWNWFPTCLGDELFCVKFLLSKDAVAINYKPILIIRLLLDGCVSAFMAS